VSYGFQFFKADGTLRFSSADAGGVLVDILSVTGTGGVVTQAYPAFTGATLRIVSDATLVTISYPSGVPTISFDTSNRTAGTVIVYYIFAL
jgi:hypothetical protein